MMLQRQVSEGEWMSKQGVCVSKQASDKTVIKPVKQFPFVRYK